MLKGKRLFGLYLQLATINKPARWLLIVALLAASASVGELSRLKVSGHNSGVPCWGRRMHLTNYSQLRVMLVKLEENPRACESSKTRQALVSLESLIEADLSGAACSMESVQRFNEFMERYMDKTTGESLPWSLRRFVLAYGEQMSNLCKENMIAQLVSGGQLIDADYNKMSRWICEGCLLGRLIGEDSRQDRNAVLMPNDLIRLMRPAHLGSKIYVQMATGQTMRRIQMLCDRRFKPIYEPILEPLAEMARWGFNYISAPLRDQLSERKVKRNTRRWYRVVLLCESIERLVIVPEDAEEFRIAEEATNQRVIRVLTEREAEEIRAQWDQNSTDLRKLEQKFDDMNFSLDLLQLTQTLNPIAMHIDPPEGAKRWSNRDLVVVDKSNKALMAAVRRLLRGKKQILTEETIKSMLWVRSMRLLRNAIEQDHITIFFSPSIEEEVKNLYKDLGMTVGDSRKAVTLELLDELIRLATKKTASKKDELRYALICRVLPVVVFVAITTTVFTVSLG